MRKGTFFIRDGFQIRRKMLGMVKNREAKRNSQWMRKTWRSKKRSVP